ncbi:hypothetical protein LCGC14_2128160, partial [marine sediment metagenome]
MAKKATRKKTVKKKTAKKVEALTHDEASRKNIPTAEFQSVMRKDEQSPIRVAYERRNRDLDPQLVWRGKDEQDWSDLEVPVVPVYIQEKVHPRAIVEDLRRRAGKAVPDPQMSFFDDFNGIEEFEHKIDFYHHDANWSNRMILGDSLLAMTSLAEKEGLKGQVQMIYIDPPYGIKFASNWQVSTRKRDVKDGKAGDTTRQPEQVRAFRDTWKLGIHSYLAYLRDRLVVARELLTETGSVFVQIGDENVHLVRSLMDETLGSDNFCGLITVKKTGGLGTDLLKGVADYVFWYGKKIDSVKYRQLYVEKTQGVGHSTGARYDQVESPDLRTRRALTKEEREDAAVIPKGWRTFQVDNLISSGSTATCIFPYQYEGKTYAPGAQRSWKTNLPGMDRLGRVNRLIGTGKSLRYLRYLSDFRAYELTNIWDNVAVGTDKIFVVQTPTSVVERCILMTTDPGDLVLDPTCGSGTTAYVAEQWGRRWITIDTSRVALALARTRLMAARFPYYL